MTKAKKSEYTDNRGGEVRPCHFSPSLKCPYHNNNCPLHDSDFIRDLEVFLYTNRSARALRWEAAPGGKVGTIDFFSHFNLALRIMVFADFKLMDDYDLYTKTGVLNMTKRKCRRWRAARKTHKQFFGFPFGR